MKNLKKTLAVLLAGMMLLSAGALAAGDDAPVFGVLEADGLSAAIRNHDVEKHSELVKPDTAENYANLSSALMDVRNGRLICLVSDRATAEYIAVRNEGVEISDYDRCTVNFSMLTMEENKEVYDLLNNAIAAMKEDGTLDSLVENELKAYVNSDPEGKDLPKFEGAKTIKVGVTGDLPPMDFVAANGKAAGFNVALLSEIANRAQVNFELVQIETGARAMALANGKVDAVFWTKGVTCALCGETYSEEIPGTLSTESYFADESSVIQFKSGK